MKVKVAVLETYVSAEMPLCVKCLLSLGYFLFQSVRSLLKEVCGCVWQSQGFPG